MTHCWGACTESSCGVNGQCPAPPVSATAVSALVKSQKISDLMSILFCPELRVLQLPWERAGLRVRVPATLPRERIRWRPWIPVSVHFVSQCLKQPMCQPRRSEWLALSRSLSSCLYHRLLSSQFSLEESFKHLAVPSASLVVSGVESDDHRHHRLGPSCQCYKTSFFQNRELEQCSVVSQHVWARHE